MFLFDKINPAHLDRRELQLTILACSTILILGAGLALLMYPIVFSYSSVVLRNAFTVSADFQRCWRCIWWIDRSRSYIFGDRSRKPTSAQRKPK